MEVFCNNIACIHSDGEKCTCKSIFLDDDLQCVDFEDFSCTKEYQNEYYIAVKTKSGTPGRAIKRGARLEYNGYTFFTTENYKILGDETSVTEERTGYLVRLGSAKEKFDFFDSEIKKIRSCIEYPLCKWSDLNHEYVMKDEVNDNDND